jgi:hypothetical protein
MFDFLINWRARRAYARKELWSAAVADIQADLCVSRANEKAKALSELTMDADAIDAHIAKEMETPEYKALEGQEKYEADKERKQAEKIAESKRQTAKQLEDEVKGGMDTAKHFRHQAATSRETAQRLRNL